MKKLSKFGVELETGTLINGAPVILFRRAGMPIYLRAVFFAGSRFDKVPGTAHFLEHMLLAGTKKFPSKNLIAEHLNQVGGDFGARTNSSLLSLSVEIPEKQDLEAGTTVLSECLTNTLFDAKTIEMERKSILSELAVKKSNPKEYIWDVSRRLFMQNTEASKNNLGTEESISAINKKDLENYREHYINSGRVAFIASGDVDLNTLVGLLEKMPLPKSERFTKAEPLPIIRNIRVDAEQYPGMNELQVHLSFRTSIENYKEYCALKLLNEILSYGRGSKLVTELRYKNGLVYSVSGNMLHSIDWGAYIIKFACHKNDLERVKGIIFDEFNKLEKEGLSQNELDNAKSKISKGLIRQLQTSESWVNFHEDDATYSPNEFPTAEDYIETINSLTAEDVNKTIRKYLKQENFFMAICGDYVN